MSSPPPSKRTKTSSGTSSPPKSATLPPAPLIPVARTILDTNPPPPPNPRKRPASRSPQPETRQFDLKPPPATPNPPPPPPPPAVGESSGSASVSIQALISQDSGKKRSRTNTPWTAAEEQRLKQMRDGGHSWSEIAKAFPNRTEGSVKKHWYKDMHYAEFEEDETRALMEAIKEYEANKWKVIGAKLGKPAKACEAYAREHFKNMNF